jgi:peroxiredoxin
MMSRLAPAGVALAFMLAQPAMAAPGKAPVKLGIGDAAPLFSRLDLQGHNVDLKSMRGKIVLVDFWASWCPPCMEEIPRLNAMQQRLGPKGFQIVGISMDDSPAVTRQTMHNNSFAYPVVMGDAKFGNLYGGVLGLPLKFLLGSDGKIRAIWSGEVSSQTVDKGVAKAMAEAATKR